jgi:Fe-S cluster assembly protein SufD
MRRDSNPDWLARRRSAAARHLDAIGLPSRRDEDWRFTELRPLAAALEWPAADPWRLTDPALAAGHALGVPTYRIVLMNGRYAPDLSDLAELPPGAWAGSLGDAISARPGLAEAAFHPGDTLGRQGFATLNAARFSDGFALALDPGVVLPRPVEVLHLADAAAPAAIHARNVVVVGAGGEATLVETFAGRGAYWTNAATTVDVASRATLRHVRVQAEAPEALHLGAARGRSGAAGGYEAFALVTGGRLSRYDVQAALAEDGARFVLKGAYLLRGAQESTLAVAADHHARDGRTDELVKGVLADAAHGVFQGSVLVREGADGTDARQLNRTLMLSRAARVDAKPELAIHADAVKCSHGATVGDLDAASFFYLQARGIDPETARAMLVEAFAAEALDAAALPQGVDAHVRGYLQDWLAGEGERA